MQKCNFSVLLRMFYFISCYSLIGARVTRANISPISLTQRIIKNKVGANKAPNSQDFNGNSLEPSTFSIEEKVAGNSCSDELLQQRNMVMKTNNLLKFSRDGHICIRNMFQAEKLIEMRQMLLAAYEKNKIQTLRHKVKVLLRKDDKFCRGLSIESCEEMLKSIDQQDIPFMQSFNLWRNQFQEATSPNLSSIALSPALGKVAAELLGVPAVRLYQDALFVKRPGDGGTCWHSDINQSPFDTNDFITCWIPLQHIPSRMEGGSGLIFATGSHRDFALPFWYDPREVDCTGRYREVTYGEMSIGDCTFHHGWTLHCAAGNVLSETRYAYTVSYIADGVRLLNKEGHARYPHEEDYQSYSDWIDEVGWGRLARHRHLPVVYSNY